MCDVQGLKQRRASERRCFALQHSAHARPHRSWVSGQRSRSPSPSPNGSRENNSQLHFTSALARSFGLIHRREKTVNLYPTDWLAVEREKSREFLLTELLISSVRRRVSSAVRRDAQRCVGPVSRRITETPTAPRKVKVTSRICETLLLCLRVFLCSFFVLKVSEYLYILANSHKRAGMSRGITAVCEERCQTLIFSKTRLCFNELWGKSFMTAGVIRAVLSCV